MTLPTVHFLLRLMSILQDHTLLFYPCKSDKSVDPEFSRITNEQTQHLIETGKSALAYFKIDHGVLSIHRGSWRTTRDKFHVHICVDVESYLRIYDKRKKDIPNWPSRDYVTKQWRWKKDPRSYIENV